MRGQRPSRQIGREIFALAGLAAIVPMLVIAAVVFHQAEKSLQAQATSALHDAQSATGRA